MTHLDLETPAAQGSIEKPRFFRRLWQSILRFDEALNFDSRADLARRISDLELRLKPHVPR
jgi:hypothetical protein